MKLMANSPKITLFHLPLKACNLEAHLGATLSSKDSGFHTEKLKSRKTKNKPSICFNLLLKLQ